MKAPAGEVLAGRGRGQDRTAVEAQAMQDAIAALPPADRALAQKLHVLVTEAAPELAHKTWHGMPAYYKDNNVLCYFKAASKFKTRYAQFGFEDAAELDDGTLWPTVYAITDITEASACSIGARVKRPLPGLAEGRARSCPGGKLRVRSGAIPDEFRRSSRSVWVTPSMRIFDPQQGGKAMWDTIQTSSTHLSHDLPCPSCGHAAHIFLACSDTCHCAPTVMPGTASRSEVDHGLVALAA